MKKSSLFFMLVLILLIGCKTETPLVNTNSDDAAIVQDADLAPSVPDSGMEEIPEQIIGENTMPITDEDLGIGIKEPTEAIIEGEVTDEEVVDISIIMRQFEFDPDPLILPLGKKIRLTITSEDVAHGFAVAEYGLNEKLEGGETKTIEFTADKAGTFMIRCSVFCGSGHSAMKGNLIVK